MPALDDPDDRAERDATIRDLRSRGWSLRKIARHRGVRVSLGHVQRVLAANPVVIDLESELAEALSEVDAGLVESYRVCRLHEVGCRCGSQWCESQLAFAAGEASMCDRFAAWECPVQPDQLRQCPRWICAEGFNAC